MMFLAGCSIGSASENEEIKTIRDVNAEEFTEYSGTYVGDNSRVSAILTKLAGGETVNHLDLSGENIHVTYGSKEGSLSQEKVDSFWYDGEDTNQNFYFNAMYLTILVPNANEYIFDLQDSSLVITRDNMVDVLSKELTDFPDDEEIWNETVVTEFMKVNKDNIEEMANNYKEYF
ncbi:DUF4825 domain-containing protein [Pseudalkalibacillus hwajinpoensis]|uniref:DUF4825 domain-containing protein n=1 Tax=Guptibacillus hwajinpoensis TaxID=208199 RepID=UPI00325BE04A